MLALGKIGDKRALETLAALQRSAPRSTQPAIAAAICLLGDQLRLASGYLTDTLKFAIAQPGFQELLRGAAAGLAALAVAGNAEAMDDADRPRRADARSGPRRDRARARHGGAAQHAAGAEACSRRRRPRDAGIDLLREAFDMLEEDFIEESVLRDGAPRLLAGGGGLAGRGRSPTR